MRVIVFGILLFCIHAKATDACQKWFEGLKLSSDECVTQCLVGLTDMSSFSCPTECNSLCNQDKISYSILKQYGLTDDEIKICDNNSATCVVAYYQSIIAEKLCLEIFSRSRTNDESDACRHYIWALLLAKNAGTESAEKILNAHENNPTQPANERAMDLSNNRLGLINFQKKTKSDEWTDKEIVSSFNEQLKNNSLVILKPNKSRGGK